jgi:hypothetical protein
VEAADNREGLELERLYLMRERRKLYLMREWRKLYLMRNRLRRCGIICLQAMVAETVASNDERGRPLGYVLEWTVLWTVCHVWGRFLASSDAQQ